MKHKFLLLFISVFSFSFSVFATHIVGGSLTYEQLGGSTYRVTLKLYRDCAAGNAAFDNNIIIEVLQGNGSSFTPSKNISIALGTITKLNPYVDTCVAKPNICVEEALYTTVVNNLPPLVGGYHLFWQRCCRNYTLSNVTSAPPSYVGESFYTFIPNTNVLISNSSPNWISSPPTFVCQGNPINFNHGATDADGDSLVYKFYDPYLGCDDVTVISPNCATAYPTFPGNVATFSKITWNPGYSTSNPLGGVGLTLSPTGILDGIPPSLGQFVVGVKCEEWRNGVKIGEILRDFQFNVVNCPPLAVPNFTSTTGCKGAGISFTNTTSPSANNYFWDFGNTATLADTSHLTNPTYTYPALGTYTVTLIGNKGTKCADTVIKTIYISAVTAKFTDNGPGCVGLAVNFTDGSTVAANSTITKWDWLFGDSGTSTLQNPSHTYSSSGTYNVRLIVTSAAGCKDTIIHPVIIAKIPVPNFTPTGLCKGKTITFTNITNPAGNTYFWNFGESPTLADTSHAISPNYTYLSTGTYTVTLVVNKGTACEINFTKVITLSSVTANFKDNGPGCVSLAVNFTDLSTANNSTITGWDWVFGDPGGTSSSQNPSHIYTASGTYNVRLIATSALGCKDTIIHQVVIQNYPAPNFTANGLCKGKTITFANTTTPLANTYFWDFGNTATLGDTSHLTNPTYTYLSAGSYFVTLVLNKGTACAITFQKNITLSSVAAAFTYPTAGCIGSSVNFTDISTVSNSTIKNWDWVFGDGPSISTLQNPTHVYTANGTYNIRLIVTSALGCKDTITHSITIAKAPTANAGVDTVSCSNNPAITLYGTVLNATGGTWLGSGTFIPNNNTLNANYTPLASSIIKGKDTLYLVTTGNGTCPADTDMIVISFYKGPTANAGSDVSVCKDTSSVPLCASITVASGGIWQTLGTGHFSDSSKVCTSYIPSSADTTAGSVIVYLTTTGNIGCLASRDSLIINFTARPTTTITSNDSSCQNRLYTFSVNTSTGSGIWSTNGTGTFSPTNTSLSGTYTSSALDNAKGTVKLIFATTNNGGCKSSYDTINVLLIPAPVVNFTVVSACPTIPVLFTDGSTSVGSIVSWNWTFGDGSPSNFNQNPSHIYNPGGPYKVDLIVTSNNGCVDTLTKTINVYEKPVANFYVEGACLSDPTLFWDSSTVVGSTINSWIWTFGDSHGSNLQNPSNQYTAGGNFPITLITKSAQGCIDTISKTLNISLGPIANFIVDDYTAEVNQVIQFTDKSSNVPIVSWFWNFGDASSNATSTLKNPSHIYLIGGIFNVCLIVTDANGCTDSICHIEIVSLPPDVPKGFTPNNDGNNDIFYVYGGPFKKLKFKIYNSWGELIFESDSQANGWDGKRNGVDQAMGVYVWTAEATAEDDQEYHLSGDVTLLR